MLFQTPPPNPSAPASCLGPNPKPKAFFVESIGITFVTEHDAIEHIETFRPSRVRQEARP